MITWHHDNDECVAVVSEPLRWRRRAQPANDHPGLWKRGRTVVEISGDWMVFLDPAERGDGWNNPISCGTPLTVEYED
jgi:hypothetical protein